MVDEMFEDDATTKIERLPHKKMENKKTSTNFLKFMNICALVCFSRCAYFIECLCCRLSVGVCVFVCVLIASHNRINYNSRRRAVRQ